MNEFKSKIKTQFDSAKKVVGKKLQEGKEFVVNNKELIIMSLPIIAASVKNVTKTINKRQSYKIGKELKENYCYDRSLGHYWNLKRPLTNSEWRTIETRKSRGELLGDILNDLRVLK